jgi:hypothetical protein
MAPLAFETARKAEYLLVELALPGRAKVNVGVCLLDPSSDRLYVKMREDWGGMAEPEDAEVLSRVAEHFAASSEESGAEQFLQRLEDTLSNTLRVTERESIAVGDFPKALTRLFEKHVEGVVPAPVQVIPFRTHLPLY